MSKNLRKKLLRDLRRSMVQFISIFVMCFLALLILTAFEADIAGTEHSVDRFFTETNLADLSITSEGFTGSDLTAVRSLPSVKNAECRTTENGKVRLSGHEKKVEFNFIDLNNISSMLLSEGESYRPGMSGIWIDSNFAKQQKISVGDVLNCVCNNIEFSETVIGIVDTPDHLYFVIDDTFTEPVKGAYGYAYLDTGEYPGEILIADTMLVDVEKVENQYYLTDADKAAIDAAAQDIKGELTKNQLTFTTKHNEIAFEYTNDDMDTDTMLATIFPGLFMTISLLGIITTMTRLVEKQRTLIGTLKALGFSNSTVIFHYTSYSVIVSLLGSISGAFVGWWTIGKLIHEQMNAFYNNPYARMELSPRIFFMIGLVSLLAALTNFLSCRKLLVQRASDILRPAPPIVQGAGFIEKTFLWRKLGFAAKWNLRDMNRNRMRTIGGFLGVTLCAALLLTAFGANELVRSEENWQYNELTPSEYTVMFSPEAKISTVYEYTRQFHGQMVMRLSTDILTNEKHAMNSLTVTEDGNLYHFQDETGGYIRLPDYGISISSKISEDYDVSIGDFISFRLPYETRLFSGRIVSVYKVPFGQGIAMTRSYFESLGAEFRPNVLYTNMTVPSSYVTERDEITSVLKKADYIRSLEVTNEIKYTEIGYIMFIAVLMGVVVMYNLGVMSFSEKVREIATLKVLGFATRKIRWILQQQNMFVTGAGTLAGLLIGKKLLVFTMNNLDDESAYLYQLSVFPYLLAFLLSFVLSVIVNAVISSKVKEIDMVEALKGVE